MNLIENISLNSSDFPIEEFREFLQLGTGFSDDGSQDTLLEAVLRAAMGAIEARTSKILILRSFKWTMYNWRLDNEEALLFPVSTVTSVFQISIYPVGVAGIAVPISDFVLESGALVSRLLPINGKMPDFPKNGNAHIKFFAGYGAWSSVPPDLRQAMLMLAATYYENRSSMTDARGQIPMGVSALIEPYKRLRLGGAR